MFLVVAHKATPEEARNFETANRYHFFHTFALFAVPFCRFPRLVSIFNVSLTGPYNNLVCCSLH